MIGIRSFGDRIVSGVYPLHSRFADAANFVDGDNLVSLVATSVGAGPLNVVVSGGRLPSPSRLRVQGRRVWLQDRCLGGAGRVVYDSGIEWRPCDRAVFRANLHAFRGLLLELAPRLSLVFLLDDRRCERFRTGFERAFRRRMSDGARDILAGDLRRGVTRLKGCGFGLTPSGDDFLAGLLVGMNLALKVHRLDLRGAIDAVFNAARSKDVLCDASLRMAREGRVIEPVKHLIAALSSGSERDLRRRTDRLLAVGETSGADFATGFVFAVRSTRWLESVASFARAPGALVAAGSRE